MILEHRVGSGELHYDLCLEEAPAFADARAARQAAAELDGELDGLDPDERALVTYQLAAAPGPGRSVDARASFDHRRLYLEFEGALSGGRGEVRRWDRGLATDEEGAPRGPTYCFRCEGERLRGRYWLEPAPAGLRLRGTEE